MSKVNKAEVRKRLLWKLATSPTTLTPLALGTTSYIIGLSEGSLIKFAFLGVALILSSIGMFITKLLFSGEKMAKDIVAKLEDEAQVARESELDKLYSNLSRDGDNRTQNLLHDLRTISKSFTEGRTLWSDNIESSVFMDIVSRIETLFEASVDSLRKTLELNEKIMNLRSKKGKQPLEKRREKLVKDVEKSIGKISNTIVKMEELEAKELIKGSTELESICDELDKAIDVAEKVEERMHGNKKSYSESEFLEAATE